MPVDFEPITFRIKIIQALSLEPTCSVRLHTILQKLVYAIHKFLYNNPFHINFTKSNVTMNGHEIFRVYFFLSAFTRSFICRGLLSVFVFNSHRE
jgi:hypothetical protein